MSRRKKTQLDPQKTARPGLRTKIFIQEDMIGAGKIALLRQIGETGSISAAARSMGLSYRRAWFLIETLQRSFSAPLIETSRGGARAGGASLTALGTELIARHEAFEAQIAEFGAPFLAWLDAHQPSTDVPPQPDT